MKDLINKALQEMDFVPNAPFDLSVEFVWGEVKYVKITPHLGDRSPHFAMKKNAEGIWCHHGTPVVWGEALFQSGSIGCRGYHFWIRDNDFRMFSAKVKEVLLATADNYMRYMIEEQNRCSAAVESIYAEIRNV